MKRYFQVLVAALLTYRPVSAVPAETVSESFERARIAVIAGDYGPARNALLGIIASPESGIEQKAKAQNKIAETYCQEGRMPEAAAAFQRTIEVYPGAPEAVLAESCAGRGRVFRQLGSADRAIREYQRALLYFPGGVVAARVNMEIGESRIFGKEYLAAERRLEQILEENPDLDADTAARCEFLLNLARRRQHKDHAAIFGSYEKIRHNYPSAELSTLSDVLYQETKFYDDNAFTRKALAVARQEWIFSTPGTNRNIRIIWLIGNYFRRIDNDCARALRFVDYLRHGDGGTGERESGGDDREDPLSQLGRLTVTDCGAQHWPENIRRNGEFPVPPPVKNWEDLREYFQKCYRSLADSDGENAARIGDYIVSCSKAADVHTFRAEEFFREQETSSRGVKLAVTRKILSDLRRQERFLRVYACVLREFKPALPLAKWLKKCFTAADENKFVLESAELLLEEDRKAEAAGLYRILLEMPLVDEEETAARAAAGLLRTGRGEEELNRCWKSAAAAAMNFPVGDPADVPRGIRRALKENGKPGEAEEFSRWLAQAYPEKTEAILRVSGTASGKTAAAEPDAEKAVEEAGTPEEVLPGEQETALVEAVCFDPENENAFAALKELVRTGREGLIGTAALDGGRAGAGTDLVRIKNLAAAGNQGEALSEGRSWYRKLVGAHPGLRPLCRKLTVLAEAERRIAAGPEKKPEDVTRSSAAVFYELAGMMKGETDWSEADLTGEEKEFLRIFMACRRQAAEAGIGRAWSDFLAGKPGAEEVKRKEEWIFGWLLLEGKEEEAFGRFKKAFLPVPDAPTALSLAEYGIRMGKIDLAHRIYGETTEVMKEAVDKFLVLEKQVELYISSGRGINGVELYRQFVRDYPDFPGVRSIRLKIARICIDQLKMHDAAIREYRELIEIYPGTPEAVEAQFLIGNCACLKKDFPLAVTEFEKFIRQYPQEKRVANARFLIAQSEMGRRERARAIEEFRRFLKDYPRHEYAARARNLMGYCYFSLGQYEESVREYEKVVTDYPLSSYRDEAESMLNRLARQRNR